MQNIILCENIIQGVVAIDLEDIIDVDFNGFLSILSEKLTNTKDLTNIQYEIVGHNENILHIQVSGEALDILKEEEDDFEQTKMHKITKFRENEKNKGGK